MWGTKGESKKKEGKKKKKKKKEEKKKKKKKKKAKRKRGRALEMDQNLIKFSFLSRMKSGEANTRR
jgi:hypothetical protein